MFLMKSVIFLLLICTNDIAAKTINIRAQNLCNEQSSNISNDNYDPQRHAAIDQVNYAALVQETEVKSAEDLEGSNRSAKNDDKDIDFNTAPKIVQEESEKNEHDTENDFGIDTSFPLTEVDYKYALNNSDIQLENSDNIENKRQNDRASSSLSNLTNIREVRSQLLDHLLEYFMNIIKEEPSSDTRKKYSQEELKLEDKLRNYYNSDLDELYNKHYVHNTDFYDNDTEYTNGRRKTEGEVRKRDDVTIADNYKQQIITTNIDDMASETIKIEDKQNKTNNHITKEIIDKEDQLINTEPEDSFLQNTKDQNPDIAINDNFIKFNKDNQLLNTEDISSSTALSDIIEDNTQEISTLTIKDKIDTELTKEPSKQTENNIDESQEKGPSEHKKRKQNSQAPYSHDPETILEREPDNTGLKSFLFGLNKSNIGQTPNISPEHSNNNYILQINLNL